MSKPNPDSHLSIRFASQPQHYHVRLRRSIILLIAGLVLACLGYFLISNDLPDYSVRRAQITAQVVPLTAGIIALIFGTSGLSTALLGIARSRDVAIDLVIEQEGIIVREDQLVPWSSIKSVSSIEYVNEAKVQLLWDRSELHRCLIVTLQDDKIPSGRKNRDGESRIKINLSRYPAEEYSKIYEAALSQFTRHGISVDHKKKWKQL